MFNPDTADRALAPCAYLVEELDLDATLAGVMFTGELQVEIDETDDWYIDAVTATNAKGETQTYGKGHPIFDAVHRAVYADLKLCGMIYDECVRHAE